MNDNEKQTLKDILLANWSHVQSLISNSSSIRWKLRGGLAAAWWASLLYDLEKDKPIIFVLVFLILVMGFFYEIELKESEERLIYKSREIEKLLNAIAIGDYEFPIEKGIKIGTSINKDTRKFTFNAIFSNERWKFYGPYYFIIFFTIVYFAHRVL